MSNLNNYANRIVELEKECAEAIRWGDADAVEAIRDEATECYNLSKGNLADRFAAVCYEADQYLSDMEEDMEM